MKCVFAAQNINKVFFAHFFSLPNHYSSRHYNGVQRELCKLNNDVT